MIYDIALIGSGPANLFAAMEIVRHSDLKVLVLERARRLNDSRNVSNGWLGGCARASVNMFLTPGFGGEIEDQDIINLFVQRLVSYSDVKLKLSKPKILKKTVKRLSADGIILQEPESLPVSEDRMIKLGDFIYSELKEKATVIHKVDISAIHHDGERFEIETNQGTFKAKNTVLGMGRGGAKWLRDLEGSIRKPETTSDGFEFGVRLEFHANSIDECLDKTDIFKLKFGDYKTSIPVVQGTVETEEVNNIKVSNGRQSSLGRNNLCNMSFTHKFLSDTAHDDIYRLSEIVNILCDGQLLREPISKILNGSSSVSPLKEFQVLRMGLQKLVRIFPNLATKCSVYGPEARLNAVKFNLSSSFETEIPNLYVVGDMSGITNSFVQAACSGLLAAQDLIKKEGVR